MKPFTADSHSIIFECVAGSQLYGTSTPTSDTDIRGVCIPPNRIHISPFSNFEQEQHDKNGEDKVYYGLRKFFNLASDNNPNILELLFVRPDQAMVATDEWKYLYAHRQQFLSKRIKQSFIGYAMAQMYKIKQHREWFINPPDHKPTRGEYALDDAPLVPHVHIEAMLNLPTEYFGDGIHDELVREKQYHEAMGRWKKYDDWLAGRNAARRELESKHGYDTKHAMHLFRLLWQARELAIYHDLSFPLRDVLVLKAIRDGMLTYDELIQRAEEDKAAIEKIIDESYLPRSPDIDVLDDLYFEVLEMKNAKVF